MRLNLGKQFLWYVFVVAVHIVLEASVNAFKPYSTLSTFALDKVYLRTYMFSALVDSELSHVMFCVDSSDVLYEFDWRLAHAGLRVGHQHAGGIRHKRPSNHLLPYMHVWLIGCCNC